MAVPFGFSVGDIIAGIGVIKTSIGAFSNTRGATESHKSLSDVLTRLCDSLEVIRGVETDAVHDAGQREAIRQAVSQCQTCIDTFVEKIAKYKAILPATHPKVWIDKFKGAVRKIQWALCEQADITRFKSDIQLQLDAISVLLVSLQIHRGNREASQQDQYRQQTCSLLGQQSSTIETIKSDQTRTLNAFLQQLDLARNVELISQTNQTKILNQGVTLSSLESQNGQLLAIANEMKSLVQVMKCDITDEQSPVLQELLRLQTRNFRLLFEAQARNHQVLLAGLNAVAAQIRLQGEIPPQVLLQQPMIFRDALDRVTPVHLEFINSREAFIAVLKVRFKDIGLEKLDRNEFPLTDDKRKRDLDLQKPWCTVMKPGQHVSMSMGFNSQDRINTCPGCSLTNDTAAASETICTQCGLMYRLIEEKVAPVVETCARNRHKRTRSPGARSQSRDHANSRKRVQTENPSRSDEATAADFRRVYIISRIVEAQQQPQPRGEGHFGYIDSLGINEEVLRKDNSFYLGESASAAVHKAYSPSSSTGLVFDSYHRRKGDLRRDIQQLKEETEKRDVIIEAIKKGSEGELDDIIQLLRANPHEPYDSIADSIKRMSYNHAERLGEASTLEGFLKEEVSRYGTERW